MWLGDNCHTLDRKSLKAQKECGIGLNGNVLKEVARLSLKMDYYPMQVNTTNKSCLERFFHDSEVNLFSGARAIVVSIISMIGA